LTLYDYYGSILLRTTAVVFFEPYVKGGSQVALFPYMSLRGGLLIIRILLLRLAAYSYFPKRFFVISGSLHH